MQSEIKNQLLDSAQALVQSKGFNGFSYQDLSREVGIKTASIHYHFPTKSDLGVALIQRYRTQYIDEVNDIATRSIPLREKLQEMAQMYSKSLQNEGKTCICAAFSGEFHSLPNPVQDELARLIDDGICGVERILESGKSSGELPLQADTAALSQLWYCGLQGSLTLARASKKSLLRDTVEILSGLTLEAV